jgi:hypothetical protein
MRWVDCCLFVLLSCCRYHGLVKALLIATRSPRVKEEGLQSGRTRDEHSLSGFCFGSLLQNLAALHSLAACSQWILHRRRVAELGRVVLHSEFRIGSLLHSFVACHSLAANCKTWLAQLGRVCTVNFTLAACFTAWQAQLGRVCTVNFTLAACCTALQRVAHLGRTCTVNLASAACCTAWPRVAHLCSV